jgi:AmmeMemoRadiSam system protein A
LNAPVGAFVTLHKGKELRGCIGQVFPEGPLYLTVQKCAVGAAVEDTRFTPMNVDELPEIGIEISVLSGLERVHDPAAIEVGQHGLMVSRGGRRGLLLPQVATEHGWDRNTFLAQTCRKASLPPDAWQDPNTIIEAFAADYFSEETFPRSIH